MGLFSDFSSFRSVRERMLAASETYHKDSVDTGPVGQRRQSMLTLDTPIHL